MRGVYQITVVLFLLGAFSQTHAQTAYELPDEALFQSCPFRHSDSFSFDGLISIVRSQLETKLAGNQACDAIVNAINDNLSSIDDSFVTLDDGLREAVTLNLISRRLRDLNLSLSLLGPGDPAEAELLAEIAVLESDLFSTELDFIYAKKTFERSQENKFREGLYTNINDVVIALRDAPAVMATGRV